MRFEFDWDTIKAEANRRKHQVSARVPTRREVNQYESG